MEKNKDTKDCLDAGIEVGREICSDKVFTLKVAINEVILGFLYKGGDVMDVSDILVDIANEYQDAIYKEVEEDTN